mmetsp:Transcript_23902/g.66231  ORF Transcript_23902/g.66231 Transcript_23902/m.66231 type:complete len:334 (+) Transcript_23902:467-1468(+)
MPALPSFPAIDEMLTIRPYWFCRMYGRTALHPLKMPRTLTRKTASKFSGSTSSVLRLVFPTMPAAWTRTSMVPWLRSAMAAQALVTAVSSPTSQDSPTYRQLLGTSAFNRSQALLITAGSRSTMTTSLAPSRPRRAAIPYPRPRAPPVTMQVLARPASAPGLLLLPIDDEASTQSSALRAACSGPSLAKGPTMGDRSVPIPSISHSTTSPGTSHRGGFRKQPTPGGVPVAITSPGRSVVKRETKAIMSSTPKTSSRVLESWRVSPLTRQRMPVLCTVSRLISSGVTITGPIGAYPSMAFPRSHWPPFFSSCQSLEWPCRTKHTEQRCGPSKAQ